jgi:hypothetical protein
LYPILPINALRILETSMAIKENLQLSFSLEWPRPDIIIPEKAQKEVTTILAELILEVVKGNPEHSISDEVNDNE